VLTLIVNDGMLESAPFNTVIVVPTIQSEVTDRLQSLITGINGLSNADFQKKDQRQKLVNHINTVILEVGNENYIRAFNLLREQIAVHMDGCVNTGVPDGNDWLVDCGT
jgi:hypothetical protein